MEPINKYFETELADRVLDGKSGVCDSCKSMLYKLALQAVKQYIRIQSLGNANERLREQNDMLADSIRKANLRGEWDGGEDDNSPTTDRDRPEEERLDRATGSV